MAWRRRPLAGLDVPRGVRADLLIIGYRSVMAIVLNETPPSKTPRAPAGSATSGFPVQEASAYAMEFGQVYLNASPRTASQRASELAPFLPPGSPDQQLGWNGGGSLTLQSEQVAGVRVQDAQHAVVTLLARVNGTMMELGVPVYAGAGGLGISGEPAWLPTPKSAVQPAPPTVNADDATEPEPMRQLPDFFTAYASGDQSTLGRFLAPGTSVTGLVWYLQGLFGPLFLGIIGIVALFFLFTREIIRFVQFVVLAVAIAVIFYTSSIVQTLARRVTQWRCGSINTEISRICFRGTLGEVGVPP